MPYRSPARYLAPLALLAVIVTTYLVVRPELGGSSGRSSSTASSTTPRRTGTPARKAKAGATKAGTRRTYTVKRGDVLGSISESTGVSQLDLIELNNLDDAQSLRVGQKLKLAP